MIQQLGSKTDGTGDQRAQARRQQRAAVKFASAFKHAKQASGQTAHAKNATWAKQQHNRIHMYSV
jgi:hypothetical protein